MLGTYLNHRIHTNAARRLRGRAQSHECTLVQGEGGHRRRSCRSLRAPCGLCLGEPSCTPSRPPPQESPNNIGNKSYYSGSNMGSSSSIAPMPSALRPIVTLQQLRFSFSFFHLHSPEGRPCMQHSTNTNSARCIAAMPCLRCDRYHNCWINPGAPAGPDYALVVCASVKERPASAALLEEVAWHQLILKFLLVHRWRRCLPLVQVAHRWRPVSSLAIASRA